MNRVKECSKVIQRFNTWSLSQVAKLLVKPPRDWRYKRGGNWQPTDDIRVAIKLLKKIDGLLGLRNMLSKNDPIIAEDFGGEVKLWDLRIQIREAIKWLEYDPLSIEVNKLLSIISNKLYRHAVNKFAECLLDPDCNPMNGVSTKQKQRDRGI